MHRAGRILVNGPGNSIIGIAAHMRVPHITVLLGSGLLQTWDVEHHQCMHQRAMSDLEPTALGLSGTGGVLGIGCKTGMVLVLGIATLETHEMLKHTKQARHLPLQLAARSIACWACKGLAFLRA